VSQRLNLTASYRVRDVRTAVSATTDFSDLHAQANLIRRREETAATRSLHNTAKMLERSPTLLRLKELEALEKVTERIDSLTVYGGLEGLLSDVVKLGA
jgi:hypothetical protein